MFLVVALVLALLAAVGVRSAGSGSAPAQPSLHVARPVAEPRPPAIVLRSAAGEQVGVTFDYDVRTGSSAAATSALGARPKRVTEVPPGARVVLAMRGAAATQRLVVVRPFGCEDRAVAAFLLDRDRPAWRVALRPGVYELDVSVLHFRVGRESGESTAALGLAVAPSAPTRVRASSPADRVCK